MKLCTKMYYMDSYFRTAIELTRLQKRTKRIRTSEIRKCEKYSAPKPREIRNILTFNILTEYRFHIYHVIFRCDYAYL